MQCSGLQVVSFLFLLTGTILIAISICTNSWYKATPLSGTIPLINVDVGLQEVERGLWRECRRNHATGIAGGVAEGYDAQHEFCDNRYSELVNELTKEQQGEHDTNKVTKVAVWEIVVLGLVCGSALMGIFSLLISPCCCNRCGCCLASFVFFAASLCASAVCTYAYYISTGHDAPAGKTEQFGWSYWCAVAGGACQFLSGVLFAVSRCRQHSYSHTV